MTNGLHMHSSNRLEELSSGLADMLRGSAGADPFAPSVVVVQTPGVARWLSLQLADSLGCCMNVEYLFPRNFIDEMCGKLLGGEVPAHPDTALMGWRIHALLPELAAMPGNDTLAQYLGDSRPLKRYQLARRVADLFDQYLLHRPELIQSWENGAEPNDWQASLWRSLCAVEPIPHLAALFPRLETAAPPHDALPERVLLFGLSTLPKLYVDFLQILGRRTSIELFALVPSEEYWGDLQSRKTAALAEEMGLDSDFAQPLLSSMGTQGRDFANLLMDADFNPDDDRYIEPESGTTLTRLQADLLHLHPKHEAATTLADGSIEVAACAGPMREVEALKDHVLHLLDTHADLRPRDILVLMPKASEYAPCIEAVFGTSEAGEPDLPFAVADRTAKDEPFIDALLRTLSLVQSRRTILNILELLEHPVIAARFKFDAESLAQVRRMCVETGVRWGLDESDREKLGFGPETRNSWKAGMDSLVMGVLMAGGEENVFNGVAPYAQAEGDRVALVGKLVEAFEAIRASVRAVEKPRPLSEWPDAILHIVNALLPEDSAYAREREAVMKSIEKLREYAAAAGGDAIDIQTVRIVLEDMLVDTIAPHGFLSGGITFAELKPMRSVPARVICILGMDDAAFPRQDRPLSFDRIRKEHRAGDRSVRAGDLYLFLETLLCAREHLYLSYSGISPQGEADTPPSVVVTDLLEYLEPGAKESTLVTRHRLQPFSSAYFDNKGPLFSYSKANCDAARATLSLREDRPFAEAPLACAPEDYFETDLDSLTEFLAQPSKFFLRNILGMSVASTDELPDEDEPRTMDNLSRYNECGRLVSRYVDGVDASNALTGAVARGVLPWGLAGDAEQYAISTDAKVFSNAVLPLIRGEKLNVEKLFRYEGAVTVVLDARVGPIINGRYISYRCSKMKAKDRLRAWVTAVALGAMREDGNADAAQVRGVTMLCRDERLDLVLPENSREKLADFVALYRDGLTRPLPIFAESSYAAAGFRPKTERSKSTPLDRALNAWYGSDFSKVKPESQDAWNRMAFRGNNPFAADAAEFMELAGRLWNGFADCVCEQEAAQ